MKTFFRRIKDWSNANQGLLSLFAIIIPLIALIPFQRFDISAASSFLETIGALLTYVVQIPFYLFLVILFAPMLFAVYLKRRKPKSSPFAGKILQGTWENRWGPNLQGGVEIAQITKDGKYIIADRHSFDIQHFFYDEAKGEVRFEKVGLGQDYRRLYNILSVQPDNKLIGTEDNYLIAYTRLS